eukprot:Tamp_37640.p2 GENE.Tamp_37640~~Tamp_37640.p2  ORF type:complete len:162 (+),score=13.99 Tamp_37640:38-487(+)
MNPRESLDSPLGSPLGHHRPAHHVMTVNEMCASPQGPPLDYSFLGAAVHACKHASMRACEHASARAPSVCAGMQHQYPACSHACIYPPARTAVNRRAVVGSGTASDVRSACARTRAHAHTHILARMHHRVWLTCIYEWTERFVCARVCV